MLVECKHKPFRMFFVCLFVCLHYPFIILFNSVVRSSYLEPIKFVQTRIHSKYTSFAISHLQSALEKKSPSEHKDNLQGPYDVV